MLRRHRASAEDERVTFLSFVLLGVDVKLAALDDGGAFDGLPGRAVDAAEDHIDLVMLDKFGRLGFRHAVDGGAVLDVEIDLPSQQAARGVDVVDHHLRHVGIGDPHERERAGLLGDDAHFDGCFPHVLLLYAEAEWLGSREENAGGLPPAHGVDSLCH